MDLAAGSSMSSGFCVRLLPFMVPESEWNELALVDEDVDEVEEELEKLEVVESESESELLSKCLSVLVV